MDEINVKTVDLFGGIDGRSQHLETVGIGVVVGVDADRVIPIDLCPALDTGNDSRFAGDTGGLFDLAGEPRPDDAFMDEGIPFFQLAPGKPLGHPGGGSGAAGGPVDGLVAIENSVTCSGL